MPGFYANRLSAPPHYPGNIPYPEQGAQLNASTNSQFPARHMQYYVDGGTQYQPPQGGRHPPPQDHGNTPNYDPPQWEGHQSPMHPHSNASEHPDDYDSQWEQEDHYGAPRQNHNPPYHAPYQTCQFQPHDPKLTKYTGKIPWWAYEIKLDLMTNKYHWDEATKLVKLVEALEDAALTFFSGLPAETHDSYPAVQHKFGAQFGPKEEAQTARNQLTILQQQDGEELKEFAEWALQISMDAWGELLADIASVATIEAFIHGVTDKEAAFITMSQKPETLDEALAL